MSSYTTSHIIPPSASLHAVRFLCVREGEDTDCEMDEEGYDDISNVREQWRVEAWPKGKNSLTKAIPFEKVIFIEYKRNFSFSDAKENHLLDAFAPDKHNEMGILLDSMLRDDALNSFSLVDSKSVSMKPYTINLLFNLPIIPYSSLSHVADEALWSGIGMSKKPERRLVTFEGKVCIYRVAEFPRDIPEITEELRKLILVKDSKWFVDLIGTVRRQDNLEAFLIHYSSKGSLALYRHRKESTKKRWIMAAANAFLEAETIGIVSLPLDSSGIVVDDLDINNVKIAYLDKAKFAEHGINVMKCPPRLANDFGRFVLDFFNGHEHYHSCGKKELKVRLRDVPKSLVCRCCIDGCFNSMSEVVEYLDE